MTRLIQRFAGTFQLLFVVAVVGGAVLLSASLKPDSSNRFSARSPDPMVVSVVTPAAESFEPSVGLNGYCGQATSCR